MRKTVLRSLAMHDAYLRAPHNPFFMEEALKKPIGTSWGVCPNAYPYDAIAEKHDLLFSMKAIGFGQMPPPARTISELTLRAQHELMGALTDLQDEYDAILWNFPHAQSVPNRLHFHLLKWKLG